MKMRKQTIFLTVMLGITGCALVRSQEAPQEISPQSQEISPPQAQELILFINSNVLFGRTSSLMLRLKVIALMRKKWSGSWAYIKALYAMSKRSYQGTEIHAGNLLFNDANGNPLYGAWPQMIQNGLIDSVLRPYIPDILSLTAGSHYLKNDMVPLLQQMKSMGFTIVVVSNKDSMSYEDIMQQLGQKGAALGQYIDASIVYYPSESSLIGEMQNFVTTAPDDAFTATVKRALGAKPSNNVFHVPYALPDMRFINVMRRIAKDQLCMYLDIDKKNVAVINNAGTPIQAYDVATFGTL